MTHGLGWAGRAVPEWEQLLAEEAAQGAAYAERQERRLSEARAKRRVRKRRRMLNRAKGIEEIPRGVWIEQDLDRDWLTSPCAPKG